MIDFGVNRNFDIEEEIDETLKKDFAVCDYGKFKKYLDKAKEILYIW